MSLKSNPLILAAACAMTVAQARANHLGNGEFATEAEIVILGEVHDNPDAHKEQANAIAALRPTAVVFEMLTPEGGMKANQDPDAIAGIWAKSDWPDFALYAPIFAALDSAKIIGAAAPRESIRSVYTDGSAALFGQEAEQYGLTEPLDPMQQAARETMQFEAHCKAMPLEMMAGMVDIQRYRDALFARAAVDALNRFGAPIAVVAGNGHARTDWGIPAVLARAAPDVAVKSIGFVEADGDMPFDHTHIVPPANRSDPCDTFKSD